MLDPQQTIAGLRATIDERNEEIRQLKAMLSERPAISSRIGAVLGLSRRQAEIVAYIFDKSPLFVTLERMAPHITPSGYGRESRRHRSLQTQICLARQKLRVHGVEIITRYGDGYCLPREAAERLRPLIYG